MSNTEHLCMGCMKDRGDAPFCPHCGFDAAAVQPFPGLPLGSMLQDRYVVGKILRQNGEGFEYLGYDTVMASTVTVREYLPQNLASRGEDGLSVSVIDGCEISFGEYKAEFLSYYRSVARMRELNVLLPIYDIFEENGAAYTISEWVESITLREFITRSGGSIEWSVARPLFMPVLSAMSAMHSGGVQHLGLSPDNLVIVREGKMKLTGFCIRAVRQADTDLAPELYSGCAAIEQYVMDYETTESTDVYGFTACLFYALTGVLPKDALQRRTDGRLLIPTAIMRKIPPHVVTALANGLRVTPEKRTPTFERLRAELSAAPTITAVIREVEAPQREIPQKHAKKKSGLPNAAIWAISCVLALIVFTVVGLLWLSHEDQKNSSVSSNSSSSTGLVSSTESRLDESEAVSEDAESEEIVVPELRNENFEALRAEAQQTGEYQLSMSAEEFSDTIAEGSIISQTPASGERMKRGGMIVVTVSRGPENRALPPVENLTFEQASQQVNALGFIPSKEERYDDEVPVGQVIGYRDFNEGEKLTYGSRIILLVSLGPDPSASSSGN